jgi:hypothetical protein
MILISKDAICVDRPAPHTRYCLIAITTVLATSPESYAQPTSLREAQSTGPARRPVPTGSILSAQLIGEVK